MSVTLQNRNLLGRRWVAPGGYREVLTIALPLMLSTGATMLQHFIDRMFLTWYTPEAIAAAMPAGLLNFAIMTIFLGTTMYVSTFVAQYFGAQENQKIGGIVWQGIYIAAIGAVVHLFIRQFAGSIFHFVGHDQKVMENEIIYFRILCLGAFPAIAAAALSGFFAGRGKPWPIMWTNFIATAVNLILDYGMIFGKLGLVEMGIRGAAIATVISNFTACVIYVILFFQSVYKREFNTMNAWRPNLQAFARLIRFGLPNGIQFSIDMMGFTCFILLTGRLGTVPLAATNIAFNINNIAFMPMLGIGVAISVLVGQHLGDNNPTRASQSVYSGLHITLLYMGTLSLAYILLPQIFMLPFASQADPDSFPAIEKIVITLLRYVAIYSIFDGLNITFSAGIKGAGDTRFVMITISILSILGLILPTYLIVNVWKMDIFSAWAIATVYISSLGIIFFLRFRTGKWQKMRVIERQAVSIPPTIPDVPPIELEI
jgi:MATE family multidrug resistance protein